MYAYTQVGVWACARDVTSLSLTPTGPRQQLISQSQRLVAVNTRPRDVTTLNPHSSLVCFHLNTYSSETLYYTNSTFGICDELSVVRPSAQSVSNNILQ